jgi:hypothetical protein
MMAVSVSGMLPSASRKSARVVGAGEIRSIRAQDDRSSPNNGEGRAEEM